MKHKARVTPPFPWGVKPVRDGVYQRLIGGHWRFAWFAAGISTWYESATTPEAARCAHVPSVAITSWRGLAENPDA